MKIKLLRCLVAMGDNQMNVSAAARELRILQPSMSKNLMDLEKEIGTLFVRRGRRFVDMTPLGREVLTEARDILLKCDNIAALRRRHDKGSGDIRIGTTHLQARYVLPAAVRQYLDEFADANIQIFQNTPKNLAQMLENNLVDMVICTEALENHPRLDSADAYCWNRSIIMPPKHALARAKPLTLKKLAAHPLITYVHGFTGRTSFDATFRRAGLAFHVAVAAADSDVIKTYVRMGAGIGVIATVSYQPKEDADLVCRSAAHLFPDMRVRMAYLREKNITVGMRRLMEIFCRHTTTMKLGASADSKSSR